jgi:FMN phosphatase YigB (HAD superfamily)
MIQMLGMVCSSLATTVPVQAVLFDIDGTLCDSDPLHHLAFQELLLEVRWNGWISYTHTLLSSMFLTFFNQQAVM